MKKYFNHLTVLLTVCLLTGFQLKAQKITGIVNDATDKPQEFATVMLMKAKDSTLVKGAATDEKGQFEIEDVANGQYFINVSIVGFKNYASKTFDVNGSDLSLDPIKLQTLDQELKEVTVVARKPMIEVKADRTVFNVEGSP